MGDIKAPTRDAVLREVQEAFGMVPGWARQIPEPALGGFWALMRDFDMAETSIPNKYKELIGVAVSASVKCRYCALFHTEGARLHGATDEEIAEANMLAGVVLLGSTFLNGMQVDYDEFRRETLDIVAHVRAQMASAPVAPSKTRTAHA